MKIYFTNEHINVWATLHAAARDADMAIDNYREFKPRDGRFAIGVSFNGYGSEAVHSARRPNARDEWVRSNEYAAAWDQWGVLLSAVFSHDPSAYAGGVKHPYYAGAEDFHHKTGDRFKREFSFDALKEADLRRGEPFHIDHVFRYDPSRGGFTEHVRRCTKGAGSDGVNQCSAVMVR